MLMTDLDYQSPTRPIKRGYGWTSRKRYFSARGWVPLAAILVVGECAYWSVIVLGYATRHRVTLPLVALLLVLALLILETLTLTRRSLIAGTLIMLAAAVATFAGAYFTLIFANEAISQWLKVPAVKVDWVNVPWMLTHVSCSFLIFAVHTELVDDLE